MGAEEEVALSVRLIVEQVRGTPPAPVTTELERIRQTQAARIARELRGLPRIDASEDVLRRDEYELEVGLGEGLAREAALLESVRPLDLAAAPHVVALVPFDDGYVLVRRYGACPGERLLPVTHDTTFHASAAARLRRDLQALAEHGLHHRHARGIAHYRVGAVSGTIVLGKWNALAEATPEECAEMLASLDAMLARHR